MTFKFKILFAGALLLFPYCSFAQISTQTQVAEEKSNAEESWVGNVGVNGVWTTGNSETRTIGGNALVLARKNMNQISWTGNASYGRARDPGTGITSTNTENWLSVLRYDRFILEPLSFYLSAHMNHDQLAGIDIYYGGSAGLANYFVRTDHTTFKLETGYDYTRQTETIGAERDVHSIRGALVFLQKFSDIVSFGEDGEFLYDLRRTDNYRFNSFTSLNLNMTSRIAFQVGYGVRFDNQPVVGFEKWDTATQMGLNVNFL